MDGDNGREKRATVAMAGAGIKKFLILLNRNFHELQRAGIDEGEGVE